MNKTNFNQNNEEKFSDLRSKAEGMVREPEFDLDGLSHEEVRKLIYELRVHQHELEIQNEELREAQEELEISRDSYFNLHDLAPIGYFTVGKKDEILTLNLTAAELLEGNRAEFEHKGFSGFIHPDDHELYFSHRKEVLDTGNRNKCELRMKKKDGSVFHVLLDIGHLFSNCTGSGGDECLLITATDVTERKEREKELIQLYTSMKNSSESIIVTDRNGNVIKANKAALNIFSHPVGKNFIELIDPQDRKKIEYTFSKIKDEGNESINEEFYVSREDNRVVESNITRIKDNGDLMGFIIVGRDVTDDRRRENEIRRTRDTLEKFIDKSPLAIVGLDENKKVNVWNPAAEKIFGWSKEEILGHDNPTIPEEYLEEFQELYRQARVGRSISQMETWRRRSDGTIFPVEVSSATYTSPEGSTNTIAIVADISRRKEYEEALEETKEKYKNLVENINEVIYSVDQEGIVTYVSPVIERLTGYKPFDIIGKSFTDFIYSEDLEKVKGDFEETLSDRNHPSEARLLTVSGDLVWVRNHGKLIRDGNRIVGTQGVITDITELKKKEAELNIKDKAISSSINGIALADSDGYLTYANKASLEMWGYDEKEIIGKHLTDFWESKEEIMKVGEALADQGSWEGELVGERKDGSTFNLQVSATYIKDENGEPLGYLGTFVDITDKKKNEKRLKRMTTAMENSNESIIVTDVNGYVVDFNPATLNLLGAPTGKKFTELVDPRERKKVEAALSELKDKESMREEYYVSREEESSIESNMTVIKDNDVPTGFIIISRDISERKKAEKDLKKKLMKFKVEEGDVYLDGNLDKSINVLKDLADAGYPCVMASRTPRKKLEDKLDFDCNFWWIAEKSGGVSSLTELRDKIENLPKKKAVLIDRLDYFISRNGFRETLSFIHALRDITYLRDLVVILVLDPSTLDEKSLALLSKETSEIEPRDIEKMSEDLLSVLKFVYSQNKMGAKPSHTEICNHLDVSKPTVRKKIKCLVNKDYLIESVEGTHKRVEVTDKTRNLFWK